MRKITLLLLIVSCFGYAQVFTGKDDKKFQVGALFQDGGTGIITTLDLGLGQNMSIGAAASYLLGVKDIPNSDVEFLDRFDAKLRFNANIADVLGAEEKLDVYPGLNLGIRNFGAHLGARYFFTEGFGIYAEMQVPIAKYNTDPIGYENLNNQFNFSLGASFNL